MKPKKDGEATIIDLLRHGEPLGGEKYRGTVDDPLSPTGWQQMRNAVSCHPPWSGIITSPMRRCAAFAQELGAHLNIPVHQEQRFREMRFGLWEGRTASEIMATDQQALTRFWQDPLGHPPPEGEHLEALKTRVMAGWRELLLENPGKHLLLVAHGGIIRMLISQVLAMPLQHLSRITVPYACVSRVQIDRVDDTELPRLLFHAGTL